MDTRINLVDGSISAYGLACGYIDVKTRELESGRTAEIRLSYNGNSYDVDAALPGEYRERIELSDGSQIISGWAQFDKLSDARKFQRRLMSPHVTSLGVAYAHCLTVMMG